METSSSDSFSKRFGYVNEQPITVWEDAPSDFRYAVLSIAEGKCDFSPNALRSIACEVLRKRPDPSNWSPYPNIWDEVQGLVESCEWYKVFDIVEALQSKIREPKRAALFEAEINAAMRDFGIGWQLVDGSLQVRGADAHEAMLKAARRTLEDASKDTAQGELSEAIKDISRRPHPDVTGAVQHAMAALECVARDVTSDRKSTLGKILADHKGLIPPPVDQAAEKLWGFASEKARHVQEGNNLAREEALLVVGLASALASYLIQKTTP